LQNILGTKRGQVTQEPGYMYTDMNPLLYNKIPHAIHFKCDGKDDYIVSASNVIYLYHNKVLVHGNAIPALNYWELALPNGQCNHATTDMTHV
jgi:hypothetical protein